jgi:nicotinate phosphoribosyltransferase
MPPAEPLGTFTDLYEFTMAQSYLDHGQTGEAVFDLHVRGLPTDRGFLTVCGTQALARRLDRFTFTNEDLAFLEEQGLSGDLIGYLDGFSFEGRVRAMPEGTAVFPYEPIVQIEAPLVMAQLVETLVLNTIHLQTVIASKAARCQLALDQAEASAAMVDFGARRAHGLDAGRAAARAAYVAGFAGTSLVSAAREMQIPCFGTMAHAYVQAFGDEREALASFARSFPDGTTLLIDTFDIQQATEMVIELADELADAGVEIGGVRIDSGDLVAEAERARARLDEAGLADVDVFVSGGLDEHEIARILAEGAPVDGFGVGTSMVVSDDAPSLNLSYKLAAYEGEPVMKTSEGKRTLPAAKQVYRRFEDGRMIGDVIARVDEEGNGQPLLEPLTDRDPAKATHGARQRFADQLEALPPDVATLADPAPYAVERSAGIEDAIEAALERAGQA